MAFNKPLTYGNLAVTEVISGCGLAAFSATVQTLAIDTDVVEQPLSQPFCGFAGLSVQALTIAA